MRRLIRWLATVRFRLDLAMDRMTMLIPAFHAEYERVYRHWVSAYGISASVPDPRGHQCSLTLLRTAGEMYGAHKRDHKCKYPECEIAKAIIRVMTLIREDIPVEVIDAFNEGA